MKKQIEEIAKKERKLEEKFDDLKSRISNLEKLSPSNPSSIVRFSKPSISLTKGQKDICFKMLDIIDDQNERFDKVLKYNSKRK